MNSITKDTSTEVFDITKWQYKILNTPVYFLEIYGFVKEKDLVSEYIDRREIETVKSEKIIAKKVRDLPDSDKAPFIDYIGGDLEIAVKILSRQMIVLAATYIEGIISEFLILIFSKYPERMYEYIGQDISHKGKGKVSLREIIYASSKEELIYTLSERAALQATSGKFSIVRKRIEIISNCDLDENLGSIIELRNKIVHEAVEPEISEDEVIDTYKNLEKMLYEIGKKSLENGIEIKDDLELLSQKSQQ